MRLIRFVRPVPPYGAGETAGFDAATAAKLIGRGVAVPAPRAPEMAPAAPVPTAPEFEPPAERVDEMVSGTAEAELPAVAAAEPEPPGPGYPLDKPKRSRSRRRS